MLVIKGLLIKGIEINVLLESLKLMFFEIIVFLF